VKSAQHWFYYVAKLAPERRRRFPGSSPLPLGKVCPRHRQAPGELTRICWRCHDEAWDWTAERYLQHLERQSAPRQVEGQLDFDDFDQAA
jgi:5-methylcytosine-specific restriction endonuclease McrA